MERTGGEPLEWSWTTHLRLKAFHTRKRERPFESKLTKKDDELIIESRDHLERVATALAEKRAAHFWEHLTMQAANHPAPMTSEFEHAVVRVYFQTFLGSREIFWNDFFVMSSVILRIMVPHMHDEEIWDEIYPIGLRAIRLARMEYPEWRGYAFNGTVPEIFREGIWLRQKSKEPKKETAAAKEEKFDHPFWWLLYAPVVPPAQVVKKLKESLKPVEWQNTCMRYRTEFCAGHIVTRLLHGSLKPVKGWLS